MLSTVRDVLLRPFLFLHEPEQCRPMRPPPAKFRLLFVLAVFAILVMSTPLALADGAASGKPATPSITTQRLILTPAILRFGKVAIGQRSARSITLTNASDSDITLLRVTIQGRD